MGCSGEGSGLPAPAAARREREQEKTLEVADFPQVLGFNALWMKFLKGLCAGAGTVAGRRAVRGCQGMAAGQVKACQAGLQPRPGRGGGAGEEFLCK